MDSSASISAIDVHGHYGVCDYGKPGDIINELMTGDGPVVAERAAKANIRYTIVSPLLALFPRGGGDAVAGNSEAAQVVAGTPGLLQYVVIDPRVPETYRQAEEMLQTPKCVGIKIHPEEHIYSTAMQRARIDHADLSDADKRLILRDNAVKLFGSKLG